MGAFVLAGDRLQKFGSRFRLVLPLTSNRDFLAWCELPCVVFSVLKRHARLAFASIAL